MIMKDKKLQIFVSSTYLDLKEERQAAVEAILSSGHIPAGMELFDAGDESQMTVIERWIDESDIYLLILGGRYGSIDPKTKKSYTQLEYEYALSMHKPLFAVVISEKALDEKVKIMGRAAMEDQNPKLLKKFKSIVLSNLIKPWDDKKDIKIAIHETLSDFAFRKELIGWTRGDKAIDTGLLAEEIARLTKENSVLREKLAISESNLSPLYMGLNYSQFCELLTKETYTFGFEVRNLFDFFLRFGERLFNGFNYYRYERSVEDDDFFAGANMDFYYILMDLCKYKIVKQTNTLPNNEFRLTDEGHNFYLKTLVLKKDYLV